MPRWILTQHQDGFTFRDAAFALAMERLKADAVHARVWRSAHARPATTV